jgi:hypothetical protein
VRRSRRSISRQEGAAIFAAYAPKIRERSILATVVLVGVGLVGLIVAGIGIVKRNVVLLGFGLCFVGVVGVMTVRARPMHRERMLVLRGRVLRLERPTSESGAELEIELSSVLRFRPDGLARTIEIERRTQKLGIDDQVYEELKGRPEAWTSIELVAGNDSFVLATLSTARKKIGVSERSTREDVASPKRAGSVGS